MKKFMPVILAIMLTLSAFSVRQAQAAPPVPPTTRLLVALMSGPAIDGVAPTAKAEFGATQGQTALEIRASNLSLPDGTRLNVAFGRTVLQGIPVRAGSAFLSLSPSPEEVRPGELITIVVGDGGGVIILGSALAPAPGTVILSGTFQAP